jgi:hypothetical protein
MVTAVVAALLRRASGVLLLVRWKVGSLIYTVPERDLR